MPFIIETQDFDPPPLLDPATPISPPDLLDDLPPFEQNSRDIQGVLTALGNELGRIEAARQDLIANFFPGKANALLRYFEQMLGLPVESPTMSLDDRRVAVLAFMQAMKSTGSAVDWAATLTSLIGTGWSFRLHDPSDVTSPLAYVLLLRVPYAGPATVPTGLAAVVSGAGGLVPATYFYAVTAYTGYGETLRSAPVTRAVSGANATVSVSWTASASPTVGYRVYRGLSSTSMLKIADVANPGTGTVTFADDGSAALGSSPPTVDLSASLRAGAVTKLARAITPAHLDLNVGYSAGFIIGVSAVGIEPL